MNAEQVLQTYEHSSSLESFLMKHCLRLRQWSLLISLFICLTVTALDFYRFPPEACYLIMLSRTSLVMIPLLILNYLFWFSPPKSILTHVPLLLTVFIGAGINHNVIHYFALLHDINYTEIGILLIIMLGCLLLVIPVFKAGMASAIIIILYGISHYFMGLNNPVLYFSIIIFFSITLLFLLISNSSQKILIENFYLIKKLHEDSTTDALTTLFNRRFFKEQFKRLLQLSERNDCNLALLLIDVDHFKSINDKFGHTAGDLVLQNIATFIKQEAHRPCDYCFRIGGDEMAVILFDTSQDKVESICNKLSALENIKTQHPNSSNTEAKCEEVPVTLSIGCAIKKKTSKSSCEEMLEASDKSLYISKNNGRNQFTIKSI